MTSVHHVVAHVDMYIIIQVNKWYVVLNGQLKLVRESDSEKSYHVGDL